MIIRKNTKAFKTILQIVTTCKDRHDRDKLIRLYITKGGQSIRDRINIEGIQSDSAFFYDLNYQAVLDNLNSPDRQLNMSDEIPGLYFFHSSSNKIWDETPFEFDKAIEREFASLAELPVFRKKDKVEKISIPKASESKSQKVTKGKEKYAKKPAVKEAYKEQKQPNFKLKHAIRFSNLEDVVFRNAGVRKLDVLEYYDRIAEVIIPYLKDRPLPELAKFYKLKYDEFPGWIRHVEVEGVQMPLCNDKEHLLFFVEMGCIEFRTAHAKVKSIEFPDYAIIALDNHEADHSMTSEVMLACREILDGLKLPSLVKIEQSAIQIYIPLDGKCKFESSRAMAEYICKLIKLKIRDTIVIKGVDKQDYGRISIDYLLNDKDQSVIAPYSLASGTTPSIATPLLWDEITKDFANEELNLETTLKRIKRSGDLFASIFKNKMNAEEVLKRLKQYYSFLI